MNDSPILWDRGVHRVRAVKGRWTGIDRRVVLITVAWLASCSTRAVDSDLHTPSILTELSADFSAARSQPLGSRPAPPYVYLERLIGLSAHSIQAALGAPDRRQPGAPLCEAAQCWSYTYGPAPAPISGDVQHDGSTDFIVVSTGGPFLLILGFSSDRVISAEWLGQR